MANSRIMLTCKHCGEQKTLASGYIGAYYCTGKNMEDQLNEFFKKHEHGMCSDDPINSTSDNARDHFVILEEGEDLEDFVEITEVKHGEWVRSGRCDHVPYRVKNPEKWVTYRCSVCGYRNGRRSNDNYCPNCGATMDGGK